MSRSESSAQMLPDIPKQRILNKDELDSIVYSKEDLIGSGAFGDVYRGTFHGYPVAIKVVDKKRLVSLAPKARDEELEAEARILCALSHPRIVMLIAFYQDDERYILVQQLEAQSLHGAIHRRSPHLDSLKKRLNIALEVIAALRYLHGQNYMHRDLKAENILLDKEGYAKLADFGLARVLDQEQLASTVAGTPWWRAPEIVEGAQYAVSADVFSLGVTLAELFTNQPGDDIRAYGLTKMKGLNMVVDNKQLIGFVAEEAPHVCPQILQILVDCCNPVPEERPTLNAVQCGLEAVLASVRALEAHVSAQLSSYPSALKVVMDLATYAYSGDFATAKIPSRVVLERIETEIKESAKSLTAEHSAFLAGLLAKAADVQIPPSTVTVDQLIQFTITALRMRDILNLAPVQDLWQAGFLFGFVSAERAAALLATQPPGTFLVRFSASSADPLLVFTFLRDGATQGIGVRVMSHGFTHRKEGSTITFDSLGDALSELEPLRHLEYVYPDIPKSKFANPLGKSLASSSEANLVLSFVG